jgi:hypothetical protein
MHHEELMHVEMVSRSRRKAVDIPGNTLSFAVRWSRRAWGKSSDGSCRAPPLFCRVRERTSGCGAHVAARRACSCRAWGLRCSGTENRVKVVRMHGQFGDGQFTLRPALLGLIG